MVYKVIGMMSGSSLDGLDIIFAELEENAGVWNYKLLQADCIQYETELKNQLLIATSLSALNYQLLNSNYGKWIGIAVNNFIQKFNLQHQVHFVVSHGHTTFHSPENKMTHQIGDGAAIAAETGLPVISDLRSLDVALGGQGAPIVPIGELLLFPETNYFLNIGGIANLSFRSANKFIAFDVCPANRVLNMIAELEGKLFDEDGQLGAKGVINSDLLEKLNKHNYYDVTGPKSLSNSFGVDMLYPIIIAESLSVQDSMATFVAHIVYQIKKAFAQTNSHSGKLMITGGGANNKFLIQQLTSTLAELGIEVYLPTQEVINYKEALIMALIGVLRWREQNNIIKEVTGASRNSIGGALWMGGEG